MTNPTAFRVSGALLLCLLQLLRAARPLEPARALQLRTAAPGSESPPAYMLHLYDRYRKGRMPHAAANTVRSFFPTPGRLGKDDLLVFNLTGVRPDEYVERVDLHLHPKRHVRLDPRLDPDSARLQVEVLDLSLPLRPGVETVPLPRAPRAGGGWQTVDLTDAVIACLAGEEGEGGGRHRLVGVAVRGGGREGLAEPLKAGAARPFLVLFSEDDERLRVSELDRGRSGRSRRQVLDNELPDYPMDNASGAEVQARLKYRPLDTAAPRPEARAAPEASESEKHRKRRRRRRRKDRRLPAAWGKAWWKGGDPADAGDDDDDEDRPEPEEGACRRRKMAVDFAEIGWSDWVIAPKTFDASYCAGRCPFPLTEDLRPSNHAALQGLIRALGVRKEAPEPCCVAGETAPAALLFRDEEGNVVLKNYPDMSVSTCTCR